MKHFIIVAMDCHHNYKERTLEALRSIPSRFARERKAIIEAFEFCCIFSDRVGFEICNANLGIEKGLLILLDCFYTWDSPKRLEN